MSDSGPRTAVAVTRMVRARQVANAGSGLAVRESAPAGVAILLGAGRHARLPVVDELQALVLVEVGGDLGADRDGLQLVAHLLLELAGGVLGIDVVAQREQLNLPADHLLAPLRQDVVEE